MKSLIFMSLFMLGCVSCGIDEMNVGPQGDVKTDGESVEVTGEHEETAATTPDVTVSTETTTTTTTTISGGKVARTIVHKYELVGENPANKDFVGGNYCLGNSLGECYLRSGFIAEYSDGKIEVSLEFMDTYNEERPYRIVSAVLAEDEQALLLTDEALSADDDGVEFKKLWAVVVKKDKTMAIVYDRNNDGPTVQGDDMLDALEFVEVAK